ncbi:MAG: hypothetical protein JWP88_1027 [Flaviaesturariibacter sp.]|nr:hypothetical protein [Flaviaesturariibacter sp.]
MIAVYSHTNTQRLQYVLKFLSGYYGHSFELFTDKKYFLATDGVRLNYSGEALPDSFQLNPVGLLFDSGIQPITITCFQHANGYPAFFGSEDELGFDLFAAVFYLLSRYEEYLPHQKDMYGRYAHQNSIAFQNGFLHLPVINIWLEDFRHHLNNAGSVPLPKFSFQPTYDIDMAWSYREKGIARNVGGFFRSLATGNFSAVKSRMNVLTSQEPDPFDCFGWLDELHRFYQLKPQYFFHVGKKRNRYDKSIPTTNEAFQKLIKATGDKNTIGLHPSWRSGDHPSLIVSEKRALENILKEEITSSRQHYIRFTLPQTFRQLIDAGISDDYSMGYGSINGFRASVATPFYWYDLEKETGTTLRLHPFCFMDANAFYEQKLSASEAYEELLRYYTEIKKVKGDLITIWHNNILGSEPEFARWRKTYQRFLEHVASELS